MEGQSRPSPITDCFLRVYGYDEIESKRNVYIEGARMEKTERLAERGRKKKRVVDEGKE